MTDPPVSISELMIATGLCRASVYKAIDKGQLPGSKLGGKFVVPRDAFEAWKRGLWTPVLRQPESIRPVPQLLKRRAAS